jgi:lipid II:glycine glycyltransferase (peptidoglycan interpeptide bridge formation enzyme)
MRTINHTLGEGVVRHMTAVQQSPHFARALTAYGADVSSTAPVILRRSFGRFGTLAFASRTTPRDVAHSPVRVLNGEKPCPRPYRAAGFRPIVTPTHIAEWDLTQHDLSRSLHPKWRNRLVKGEAHGLRLREAAWDGSAHPTFSAAERQARSKRCRTYPAPLLMAFAQKNSTDATVFESYGRGTLLAACLILRHGQTATYQAAWATATGRALQAPRIVLWAAAQQMANLGHDVLDLGVIETDFAAGLARFKLSTGAAVRSLGGTWVRLRTG